MICLVDTNNIIMICFSMANKMLQEQNGIDYEFEEKDIGFFYHIFSRKIFPILKTYKNIIFCFDSPTGKLWRRNIYPLYKENRKQIKFINNDFFVNLRNYISLFKCKTFIVDDAEGDDVIYKICEIENEEEIIVISSDGDFRQLLDFFPYVKVFNPIKQEFFNKKPNILFEKAIVGDPSDNIKGLSRIGKETFKKMMEDKLLWTKKMTPNNIELFESILKIVDLRKSPIKLQTKIEKQYKELIQNEFNIRKIESFYKENKMNEILEEWKNTSNEITLLHNEKLKIIGDDELEEMIQSLK